MSHLALMGVGPTNGGSAALPIELVAHNIKALGTNGGTTNALDTRGCDLILLTVSGGQNVSQGVAVTDIVDSVGLTWAANPPTRQDAFADDTAVQIFYAKNATGAINHTFTLTHTNSFCSCSVSAWKNTNLTSPYDQDNGDGWNNVSKTNFQAATGLTPSQAGCLVMSGHGQQFLNNSSYFVDPPFNVLDVVTHTPTTYGLATGYLIQTTPALVNPAWSWASGMIYGELSLASFKGV